MLLNIRFTFLAMLCCLAGAQAEIPHTTAQQSSMWLWAGTQVRLTKHFGIQAETVIRLFEFQKNQQHEFHIGADVYINNNIIVTPAAYGFFLNFPYGRFPALGLQPEHRLWHQIFYRNNWGRVHFNARLRSEENWRTRQVKDANGRIQDAGYTFKMRLRPRVQLSVALNHRNILQPKTVFVNIWDDMYAVIGPDVVYHWPEENRAQIGIGYRFTDWAVLNAGYMHQLIFRSNGTQLESNHNLMLQAFFQIDARKRR